VSADNTYELFARRVLSEAMMHAVSPYPPILVPPECRTWAEAPRPGAGSAQATRQTNEYLLAIFPQLNGFKPNSMPSKFPYNLRHVRTASSVTVGFWEICAGKGYEQ